MVPPLTESDLEHRRPVWAGISDMYLDTDVSDFRAARARTLAASPYSLEELDAILLDEVHPALHWNLWSVAGEWQGWDDDVVEKEILKPVPAWRKMLRRLSPNRKRIRTWDEWTATKRLIEQIRGVR